jgi:hypothetical protein
MQVEDGVAVARHLGRVGLAVEHAKGAAGALGCVEFEIADDKREQICRERFGLGEADRHALALLMALQFGAVAHRLPLRWRVERQRPTGLQIRLIEHRQRQVGAGRHEEGIQKIRVSVERRVAGRELNRDLVGARLEHGGRDDDVPVDPGNGRRAAVGGDGLDVVTAGRKVNHQRVARRLQIKCDRIGAGERSGGRFRHCERQPVHEIADAGGARFGDLAWNPGSGRGRLGGRRGRQEEKDSGHAAEAHGQYYR